MRAHPAWRRTAFFAADRLRGGVIAGHAADVQAIVDDPTSQRSLRRRDEQVSELLNHAAATVPFYRQRLGGGTHVRIGPQALAEMPVLDKWHFRADPAQMQSSAFDVERLPTVRTSGSSGTPFVVPRDPVKRARHIGDLIVFGRMAGHNWGESMVFASTNPRRPSTRSLRLRFQGLRYVPATRLDDAYIADLLHIIDQRRESFTLLGMASTIDFVGRRLEDEGRALPTGAVKGVIAIGETLSPWVTANGAAVFGAPVYSRYSNEENGILAQQSATSEWRFAVNHASFIIEILRPDSDQPAPPGEPGRIVITDLYSRALPLIRYDTGDLGRWSVEAPNELAEVFGRRMDMLYDDQGRLVPPGVLIVTMQQFDGVRQFQLVQTGRLQHVLHLSADPDPARDAAMIARLQERLGPRAVIDVRYVDGIAPYPSGKRRPLVNAWASTPASGLGH